MPYLHLDLPVAVAPADRAEIAGRLARTYADLMETNPERVTVAFRELGENGVVRLRPDGALETVVMVNCETAAAGHPTGASASATRSPACSRTRSAGRASARCSSSR